MSTVRVLTADRMEEIEAQAIVGGTIVGDDLILTRHNDEEVNAGNVRGDVGPTHSFPGCNLQTIVDANSLDSTWHILVWGGVDPRDTDNFHAANSDTIIARFTGWYNLSGAVGWEPSVNGPRLVRYTKNGSGDERLAQGSAADMGTRGVRLSFSEDIYLENGDFIRISAMQESGGNLMVSAGSKMSLKFLHTE